MKKKMLLAMLGLVFAVALVAPPKANAEVVFGVGVGRPGVGVVVAAPRPYVYAPAPYVAYGPGYAYPGYVPGRVIVGYRPYYGYRHEWRGEGWHRDGWRR